MTVVPAPPTGARQITDGLVAAKVEVASYVPDTRVSRLVEELRRTPGVKVAAACRKEEAVAIACGANPAGRRGAVLMQNVGLPAFARLRALGTGLLALDTAFGPAEPIPLYRDRPPDVRAQFAE